MMDILFYNMQFLSQVSHLPINSIERPILNIASPFTGRVVPASSHPNPLISTGTLGKGICVEMTNFKIVTPISGTIKQVRRKGCEFIIEANNGLKILINILLPQEYQEYDHHTLNILTRSSINQGEVIAYFDLPMTKGFAWGTMIVLNAESLGPCYHPLKQVTAGKDPLITITK